MEKYYEEHIEPLVRDVEEKIDRAPVSLEDALELYEQAMLALKERVDCMRDEVREREAEEGLL